MSVDFWIAIFKSSTCSTCIILMINVNTVSWCPCHSRYLECKLYKSKIFIQIENVTLPKTDGIYQSKGFNNSRTVQKEISDSKAIFSLYLTYEQKLTEQFIIKLLDTFIVSILIVKIISIKILKSIKNLKYVENKWCRSRKARIPDKHYLERKKMWPLSWKFWVFSIWTIVLRDWVICLML